MAQTRKPGVLPSQHIAQLLKQKAILGKDAEKRIQPNSLDLVFGKNGYRIRSIRTPRPGESVQDVIDEQAIAPIDLRTPTILERGATYLIELDTSLKLPSDVSAHADSKSSTGRLDIQARLLADGVPRYDSIPRGYQGKLYLYVCSNSFLVRVKAGVSLNQLQFLSGTYALSDEELAKTLRKEEILTLHDERVPLEQMQVAHGVTLHLDLSSAVAGYRARRTNAVVDLLRSDNPAHEFWEPVSARNGRITLEKGEFYILSTLEGIRAPPHFCAYLPPFLPEFGEFRSHYAGFIDSGFGYGTGELRGATITLEVRSHDASLTLLDRAPVARLELWRTSEPSKKLYGVHMTSNYQAQRGPRLSRYFATEGLLTAHELVTQSKHS
jgi:dCTP deaminase